ncbi:hypothetical protein BGX34_002822 [Mortierella sp. NVP85]|nr:hypothetical protein BGX34_002822 [Mortierella sp. NVP85]
MPQHSPSPSSSSLSPPPSTASSLSLHHGESTSRADPRRDNTTRLIPLALHNRSSKHGPQVARVPVLLPQQVRPRQHHGGGALLLTYPWRRRNALAPLEASSRTIPSRTEDLRSYNVGPHQHALVPPRHRWSQYDCNVNDLVDYDIVVPESPPPETDVYPFPPRVDCRRETNAPSPSTVRCPSRSSLHSPAPAPAPTPVPAPLSFQPPYVYSSSGKDTDDEDDEEEEEANTSDMEKLSIQEQNHNEGGGGDSSKRSRRPWTDSESAWLLECVEKHTKEIEAEVFRFAVRGKSWSRIAQLVGNGRTPTSCSNKYHKLMREH